MWAEITYTAKIDGYSTISVDVKSERAALQIATRLWAYGYGDIVVNVNGHRRVRRFWSNSVKFGLYGRDFGLYGWDK